MRAVSHQAETGAVGGTVAAAPDVEILTLDTAIEDAERDALADRAAGSGVARLGTGRPVLATMFRVHGVRAQESARRRRRSRTRGR